jgi:hypothetical protein
MSSDPTDLRADAGVVLRTPIGTLHPMRGGRPYQKP